LPPFEYCPSCGTATELRPMDGRLRPYCETCQRPWFEDPKVAAAVVVTADDKVLLVRRAFEPHRGTWNLPAGFVDAGEDPRHAGVREVLEETGLRVSLSGLVDVLFEPAAGDRPPTIVIIYEAGAGEGELQPGDDADEVAFFPLDNLPTLGFASTRAALARRKHGADPAL
jgi:8-oxo-dGTP diphosphatase